MAEESRRDVFDTHEYALVECLHSMVTEDGFYSLRRIREEMATAVEHGNWLSERYVGNLLRRFGFNNRRRVRSGTEYFLTVERVTEAAQRFGIGVRGECSEDTGVQGSQTSQNTGQLEE